MIIKQLNDDSVIDTLFALAGYTYGPLLGLYAFGMITKSKIKDRFVPIVCVIAPIVTYYINENSEAWFNYKFSFELLILNGLITFIALDSLRDIPNWDFNKASF